MLTLLLQAITINKILKFRHELVKENKKKKLVFTPTRHQ